MIRVKMYPAKNGDCFLISIGKENKRHILIDSGYVETYELFLKKDLIKIDAAGERINLMIISHIDEDHVLGAINFIEENNRKTIICIDEIWFNSYRHLQVEKQGGDLSDQEKDILKNEISLGKSHIERASEKKIEHSDVSARQGSTLGALILQGNYKWNNSFEELAVSSDNKQKVVLDDISFYIISPNDNKLEKLKSKWLKELKKTKWNFKIREDRLFDDAYEFMMLMNNKTAVKHSEVSGKNGRNVISIEEAVTKEAEPLDDSTTNGSSIAIIIEYKEKRLLFLADAHPDIILESLKGMEFSNFDLVKLPHHGSRKNMSSELAKQLKSEVYLISTNGGKHLHPDLEAMAKILFYQSSSPKKFYFNYETTTSKRLDEKKLRNQYNYSQIIGSGEEAVVIEL